MLGGTGTSGFPSLLTLGGMKSERNTGDGPLLGSLEARGALVGRSSHERQEESGRGEKRL